MLKKKWRTVALFHYWVFLLNAKRELYAMPFIHKWLPTWQIGRMAFWGAAHALSNLYFLIINHNPNPNPNLKALDEDRQADVIFLDFVKAFNRVAHDVLWSKLNNFGISGALLNWCKDYLTKREQRVVTDGVNSSRCSIPSSICEPRTLVCNFFTRIIIKLLIKLCTSGLITIWPPFFFIFDQREVVTPGNTVSLYAYDCKTSRLINCPADHSLFQINIKEDIIEEEYCKKRSPLLSNLRLNISTLKLTFELCDLGLITKSNLAGTIILIR